ncbi:hypothetical protein [Agaribacter flavus]|uniref:Uncharacterized protein n=1 Tax=Agaribacter flavus TaxID=1902781 RepID=A0ABV7FP32_9ALTE
MKQNKMLKENIPYAKLIYSALDLCEAMLSKSALLYPFAVVSIDNDVQCLFTHYENRDAQQGMIEELEEQIGTIRLTANNTVGVLVYAATIAAPNGEESDALVFSISDSANNNTITLYPYTLGDNTVELSKPYTCDFFN